jgi:hypothetical protein
LDWDDAEMWLEGAVQSGWSVSQMRGQRCEAMGQSPADASSESDPAPAEFDEDAERSDAPFDEPISTTATAAEVIDPEPSARSFDPGEPSCPVNEPEEDEVEACGEPEAVAQVRPFENLPTLPPDLNDAFDRFKLAILQHKVSGWQEVGCQDVLDALESLKQLAVAPA